MVFDNAVLVLSQGLLEGFLTTRTPLLALIIIGWQATSSSTSKFDFIYVNS